MLACRVIWHMACFKKNLQTFSTRLYSRLQVRLLIYLGGEISREGLKFNSLTSKSNFFIEAMVIQNISIPQERNLDFAKGVA